MTHPLILIVHLYLNTTDIAAYEAFEREAARIMSRYGGRIERAIRAGGRIDDESVPFEIHIVHFPSQQAFDDYRGDAETVALGSMRQQLISRTTILYGTDVTSLYGP